MIEKFKSYLDSLPLTRAIKSRINEVVTLNYKIKDTEIEDIFICEYKNSDGTRTYTSLWLFTKKYCIECKNFLSENDFDIAPLILSYCSISSYDFDFETTSLTSRIKATCKFNGTTLEGTFLATEENCIAGLNIYKKYIVANMIF